ncbi:ABC transporter permease [Thalassotalea marina]|uniref:ABC transporter permease n=1 Tax=Thalassotalea marina TaxID=1673741 RepID=A0A919BEM6_9GAMM|nr:ABC transporter permease [Thalassotalea marina]GHF84374.1 hypothetical protein GCM10017161_09730 [Thalassotalea marina]
MMNMITLMSVELTKLKRSQALLMSLLCPLAVVLLQLLFVMESSGQRIAKDGWQMYWMGTMSLWYMLMLPLFIALVTTLINHVEHKHAGLRLMLSFPVKTWQLFLVKVMIAWGIVILASLIMYGLTSLSIGFMMLLGYEGKDAFSSPFLSHLVKVAIASLPILVFGHILSWHYKNVVLPLAVGVAMTIAGMKMMNSEKYWVFNPWTYHTIGTSVSDPNVQQTAVQLGAGIGIAVLILSAWYFGRKEVHV